MYEKILVPLDGSELAEVALPYVEELAARLSGGWDRSNGFPSLIGKHSQRTYLD